MSARRGSSRPPRRSARLPGPRISVDRKEGAGAKDAVEELRLPFPHYPRRGGSKSNGVAPATNRRCGASTILARCSRPSRLDLLDAYVAVLVHLYNLALPEHAE